ncbi:MAG: hypothetical protein WCO54_10515 [Bacteroidota bacterium]
MKTPFLSICTLAIITTTILLFSCSKSSDNTTPPSCTDGIQNQGELGVDCGGPCTPCTNLTNHLVFEKYIGAASTNEFGNSIIQLANGGYMIAGSTLYKTDTAGVGAVFTNINCYSVMTTADNNYIVAGAVAGNYYKIGSTGVPIWTKTVSANALLNFIYQTPADGGNIGVGRYINSLMVVKTDASGNILWSKQMSDTSEGREIRQTTEGGYIIVGTKVSGANHDSDFMAYKLDAAGNLLWVKNFGLAGTTEKGYSVKATADGGCIMAGVSSTGNGDLQLIKLDAAGNTKWSNTYGSASQPDYGYSVQVTADGGYIAAGLTYSYGVGVPAASNALVVKVDANGMAQWTESYGGTGNEWATCIQQTSDKGFVLTGYGNYNGSKADMYLVKMKF